MVFELFITVATAAISCGIAGAISKGRFAALGLLFGAVLGAVCAFGIMPAMTP